MTRPRVCMMVDNDLTRDARVRREAGALAEAGFDVTVVCWHSDGLPRRERVDGYAIRRAEVPNWLRPRRPTAAEAPSCVPVGPASAAAAARGGPGLLSLLRRRLWAARRLRRVLEEAVASRPDIVHAHDGGNILPALTVARRCRALMVYDAHELYSALHPIDAGPFEPLLRRYRRHAEHVAARTARAVVASSEPALAQMVRLHGPLRAALVRNLPAGGSPARTGRLREALGLSAEAPLALMQGQVTRGRGYDTLVRAACHLDPRWTVAILGAGPELPAVRALARELGVEDRVRFHPAVPAERLCEYTPDADVGLVLTQPIDEGHRLAQPNKLFEYMRAGVPVVGSDLPAIRAVVSRVGCGRLVDPYDAIAVAAAVEALAPGGPEHARAREAGLRAAAGEFDWHHEKRHLVALYERLAGALAEVRR